MKNPLYSLDDASRKFYLKVKETLTEMGLKKLPGDEAFYYKKEKGRLRGAVLSHVDDLSLAGDEDFVDRIVKGISEMFTVSKVETNSFRFTGLDIEAKEGKVMVSMENYARSLEPVAEIRKAGKEERLTKMELKEYWKFTWKKLSRQL